MKRKTNKTNDLSISDTNNTKKLSEEIEVKLIFLGEYFNIHTMAKHPITRQFIQKEAIKLKQWAELDDSLLIQDFYDMQGYDPRTYYDFVHQFEEFAAANEYAKRRLGSRREIGAATRKYNENTIQKTLGHYQNIWREEIRIANEARQAIAEKSESKVVVIERFPSMLGRQDVEVVSSSSLTPEEVAGQIHRQTGDQRMVKVNTKNIGEAYE